MAPSAASENRQTAVSSSLAAAYFSVSGLVRERTPLNIQQLSRLLKRPLRMDF